MGRIIDHNIKGLRAERHCRVIRANIRSVTRVDIQPEHVPAGSSPKATAIDRRVEDPVGFAMRIEGQQLLDKLRILFPIPDGIERPIVAVLGVCRSQAELPDRSGLPHTAILVTAIRSCKRPFRFGANWVQSVLGAKPIEKVVV